MIEFEVGDSFTLCSRDYDVTRTITGIESGGMYILYTTSYSRDGKEYKPSVHKGRLSIDAFAAWTYKADIRARQQLQIH